MNHQTEPRSFVGLDVHLRFTTVCILDSGGKVVKERSVRGHSEEVCQFLRDEIDGPFDLVFEVSDGYGLWYEKLARIARRVLVAHPFHLKAIWNTKKKTDRVDAKKLARLLFLDMIPTVHIPPAEVRDWRMLIIQRTSLVQKRTAIKNQLRAILRRNHIAGPRNLWSQKNQRWLASVEFPTVGETLQREMHQESLVHYDAHIRRVETELDRRANSNPGVIVLKTIKGIGNRTAEAFVAWVDDESRFMRSKQIGAYFGFAVAEDSSGGRQRQGHITRQGPSVVRHLLVEAVQRMFRYNPVVRGWVERVMHGQPKRKPIAVVAAAHKLARSMFAMLRTGETWNPAA